LYFYGRFSLNKFRYQNMRKYLLFFTILLLISPSAFSQEFDENGDLIYNIYKLPSIEVSTGVFAFLGDVNDFNKNIPFVGKHNMGIGANLNKRFGSILGVSAGFHKSKLTGFDSRPGSYYNFQSDLMQADFNVFLHLDNDFILKKTSGFSPFFKAGIAYITFDPMSDLKDENGFTYHYWKDGTIRDRAFDPENPQLGRPLVRDYKFETKLDSLNAFDKTCLAIPVGAGVKFKLSDAFEANIALTYVFTSTDYIDNLSFENRSYPFFDRRNDNYMYSTVSLQFNIGAIQKQILSNKPYRSINFAEIDALDMDKDGIVDALDRCPYTPIGVKVDAFGCPLDDDKDGVPNYLDKELNSAPGAIVDNNGVTISPEMIEAKYIRDSLLMAGDLILEKKYSEGTPILTDDYDAYGKGTVYSHVTYPYVKANWPDNVKTIPVASAPSGKTTYKSRTTTTSTPSYPAEAANVIYKVQIGASQKPLDDNFFKDKFGVQDAVNVEQSEGWYRYTVGNFTSYRAAKNHADAQSKIEGAFVVKYESGKRITPNTTTPAETTVVSTPSTTRTADFTTPVQGTGIYFRVQIGSSPSQLTPNFFKSNFSINDHVYEEVVDGQYKYTVGYFKTYNEARAYSTGVTSVQGAFVTSYKDGKRIPLQDAINAQ